MVELFPRRTDVALKHRYKKSMRNNALKLKKETKQKNKIQNEITFIRFESFLQDKTDHVFNQFLTNSEETLIII
jgi:hypothetical protein